jgi:hypothetical protein
MEPEGSLPHSQEPDFNNILAEYILTSITEKAVL